MPQSSPQNNGQNVMDAAQQMIEQWPIILSVMQGMVRQTMDTHGFSHRVATAVVLHFYGVPIAPLTLDDMPDKDA